MPVIHFETADSAERTQIGEGIVKFAVAAGRLETGQDRGKYFLLHDDGCAVDGDPIEADDSFFFDTEAGDVLCERHGGERRDDG
ncbi:hypothetical protein [Halostella salina]|uniref:hypothetical protein n=1 Tax=Halostella salina TaxID=1547897 RepID=UPI000EF7C74E|nr:hypothetical protein [Halostella salina]